ncbi:hypothetical protein BDV95DRAFT_620379 [Massariosphaeria phaeospora]|uniref:BZIP domain-containing protein n=1 Tax=Massariosphaeria phaeospora TaxID=100035 RepID=A0A7C8M485_9PLEO|nr:hypothetical protein BDV95DRAFT_620379 [Massariosphaeria phaeospora]
MVPFPPSDSTSFTTASYQSPWLSSPAPNASRPQLNPTEFAPHQTDFVLFDQPAPVSQRPQRALTVPPSGHTFNAGHYFYANSAPNSTTEFQQQPQPQLQLQQQRPPVPLFSTSSTNFSQQNVATMADLNSNNSFDSGASLMPAYSHDASPWVAPDTAFTSINNPSATPGSTQTVSPKDVYDPHGSAPPSTAFTNLTSPDMDSPYMISGSLNDSFDTSPMYGDEPVMASDNWFSLFPEDDIKPAATMFAEDDLKSTATVYPAAPALERTESSQSMERSNSSSTNSPRVFDSPHRRKSSTSGSPAMNASITKAARRRKGPLPAIVVDPADKIALKRARNTLAARDSRQRKFDHVKTLEVRNAELEAEVEKWKSIAIAQGYSGS